MKQIRLGGKYKHLFTLVDDSDFEWLNQYKWHLSAKRYVEATIDGINYYMHRMVMRCPKGKVMDHVNRNPLDNRKSNLRICTQNQNGKNSPLKRNNKSGYIGVSWNKLNKCWTARIKVNYQGMHIGSFKDKVEAAKAYNAMATKYFGEFANLNHV